jgi:hypothetical protein
MADRPPRSQGAVVRDIQGAIRRGYRRLLVLGPAGSRRLASSCQALKALGHKVVVLPLGSVRSQVGLDAAVRSAKLGAGFVNGMGQLERKARRRRLAIVFHDLDGCSGSAGEDCVIDAIWMQARHHCGDYLVVFTVRNADFVGRIFNRFEPCRSFVKQILFTRGGRLGDTPGRIMQRRGR